MCRTSCLVSTGRVSDRHAHLDSELKGLQMSLKELETFLKWLQEAETTVNVLADASQREDLSQDTVHVKELRQQLEVGAVEIINIICKRIVSSLAFRKEISTLFGDRRLIVSGSDKGKHDLFSCIFVSVCMECFISLTCVSVKYKYTFTNHI